MKRNTLLIITTTLSLGILLLGCGGDSIAGTNSTKAELGKQLFTSKELSNNKTMACASCHDLDHAMIDPRPTAMTLGASRGDDNVSIGDRSAPTATYASFSPEFGLDSEEGIYVGGQFLDGRAATLADQAKGPFINPVEMNMTSPGAVVARAKADATLAAGLKSVYGNNIFDNNLTAYDAIADAIATFEQTKTFAPFDSKFDRAYTGEYTYTAQEAQGKALFEGKAMCVACHPTEGYHALLTDHTYDNLGVPVNTALRAANGVSTIDNGLGAVVGNSSLNGTFKVSSLRNIAVTGPYMHNGVFKDLKTVVHFYNTRDNAGINPETNTTWAAAEVPESVNHNELGNLRLSDAEEDAIVAFMKTFTDKKFEHLIP